MAKEHVEFIWIQLDRRTLKLCYLPYLSFRKGGTDNSHRLCPALTVVGELCSEKTEQWSSQRHFWKGTVQTKQKRKCENRSRLQALQKFYSTPLYVHDAMTVLLGGWSYVLCISFIFMSWWTAQTLARIFHKLRTSPPRYQNHVKQE